MVQAYKDFAHWIGDGTGLPDTMLHFHAGLAIFLLARVISGRSLGSWLPITVVLIGAILKEIADRFVYGSWRWYDTPWDVLATMFWPAALWLGIKLRPLIDRAHHRIVTDEPAPPPAGQPEPGV